MREPPPQWLVQKLRAVMPSESTVDLDDHAIRTAREVWRGRLVEAGRRRRRRRR